MAKIYELKRQLEAKDAELAAYRIECSVLRDQLSQLRAIDATIGVETQVRQLLVKSLKFRVVPNGQDGYDLQLCWDNPGDPQPQVISAQYLPRG